MNPFSDLPFWPRPKEFEPNASSDIDYFVQSEQFWASQQKCRLRNWPHAFLSRDGWIEWTTAHTGAW